VHLHIIWWWSERLNAATFSIYDYFSFSLSYSLVIELLFYVPAELIGLRFSHYKDLVSCYLQIVLKIKDRLISKCHAISSCLVGSVTLSRGAQVGRSSR
jgi:hypothetical protein